MIKKLRQIRENFRALSSLLDDAEATHQRARRAIERADETNQKSEEIIKRSQELLRRKPS